MSETSKKRPPPVGAHVFTKFDSSRALYFGGRTEQGRTDVTWIFDLDKKVDSVLACILDCSGPDLGWGSRTTPSTLEHNYIFPVKL